MHKAQYLGKNAVFSVHNLDAFALYQYRHLKHLVENLCKVFLYRSFFRISCLSLQKCRWEPCCVSVQDIKQRLQEQKLKTTEPHYMQPTESSQAKEREKYSPLSTVPKPWNY